MENETDRQIGTMYRRACWCGDKDCVSAGTWVVAAIVRMNDKEAVSVRIVETESEILERNISFFRDMLGK